MSWDAMSQIDFELCSILALEPPRPPRIVTVIKSNCSLSWKRTRLWRTGRFLQPRKLEVSKTSHLHRFRRNMIGTAKDNNMANYIVINEHQQFCKAFVTFEHLWAWLFDFCVELAGWVWIHSVGTCKSLQDQNAGLPRASIGTRNHREASEFRRTSCRTILTRCELNEFDPTKQTALRMLPFSTWPKVGDCVYVCMLPERVVFPWCFKTALDDFPWTWVMWFEQSFA